jgi:hypothetical protein
VRRLTCAELHELAPELALGILVGEDRASAIAHLASCVECRVLVEQLSETADSLLLLTPEADPPLGFESRAAAQLGFRRHRRWPRVVLVAAAAAAVAAVVGVGISRIGTTGPDPLERQAGAALRAAGGQSLRSASLRTAQGDQVGEVFAYGGKVSWVFMTVDASRDNDAYTCVLDLTGGEHQVLGWFGVESKTGSWGRAVDVDIRRVVGVRLVTKAGATAAWATFS